MLKLKLKAKVIQIRFNTSFWQLNKKKKKKKKRKAIHTNCFPVSRNEHVACQHEVSITQNKMMSWGLREVNVLRCQLIDILNLKHGSINFYVHLTQLLNYVVGQMYPPRCFPSWLGRNYYAFLHNNTNVSDTVLPGTSYCSLIIRKSKIYNKGNLRTGET